MSCVAAKLFSDDNIDIGLEGLRAAIDTGKDLAALSPIQGLDTGFAALSSIVERIQQTRGNVEARKQLVNQIQNLSTTLVQVCEKAKDAVDRSHPEDREKLEEGLRLSPRLKGRIDALIKVLHGIGEDVDKLSGHGFFLRCLRATQDAEALRKLRDRIESATDVFRMEGQIAVERIMDDICNNVRAIREQMLRVEVQGIMSEFRKNLTVEGSFRAKHNDMKSHFLQDTRTGVLDGLEAWSKDTTTMPQYPFYVLSGVAGTGKSTIAYEFARRSERDKLLGATFFFVRGDQKLSTTDFVIPTLAYQLSENQPDLFPHIVEGARKHTHHQGLEWQLDELIVRPLEHIPSNHSPIVIIIDAIDECTASSQAEVARFLYLLLEKIRGLSVPLRVLVTTRPELHIENALNSYEFRDVAKPFKLHDIPRHIVDSDITLYLKNRFKTFRYKEELMAKRPKAIEDLTARAESLFIYAFVAHTFLVTLADGPDFAVRRLDILLANASGTPAFRNQLDSLYLTVLTNAFPENILADEDPNYERWLRDVLGTIALAQDHISPVTFEALLGVAVSDMQRILARLGSLIIASASDATVSMRPLHASFPQFLIDRERCTSSVFLVDSSSYHDRLALCCLQLLMEPHALPNVHDTPLSPHLEYSCVHWPTHLAGTAKPSQELLKVLDTFMAEYLLKWFEALSYMHRIEIVAPALLQLHAWYQARVEPHDVNAQTLALLYDGYRFILEYYVPIQEDPKHIYVSALPLMPSCTLHSVYGSRYAQVSAVRLITERDSGWSPCLRVIEGHTESVWSVRFSPDGRYLVSGSIDGTVRTWDAGTGAALNIMRGHENFVYSVSFSPDLSIPQIASGSGDGTLRIWDFASGAPLHLMRPDADNPSRSIYSVAYSPNGQHILSGSGSSNDVLCLWNAVDDEPSGIEAGSRATSMSFSLPPNVNRINSIAFSLDRFRVVTTSWSKEAHIWDVRNGRLIHVLSGHEDHIWDAVFTHDGSRVISGADDGTLRVWDTATGTCITVLEGHTRGVFSVAVSRELIASGGGDSSIRLWDVESYELLSVLEGHTAGVQSLSFSPDGRMLASASDDKTIRVWDVADTGPTTGRDAAIKSLAFSNDRAYIATGLTDGTIVIRETSTGKHSKTLKGHTDAVSCLAFGPSPDHRQLVSGGQDSLVIVWDIGIAELAKQLEGPRRDQCIDDVAYSPDGGQIACGTGSAFYIWRVSDGILERSFPTTYGFAWVLEFSPDSTKLYVEVMSGVSEIYNISTGEALDETENSWELARAKETYAMKEGWIILKQSNKRLCWLTGSKRAADPRRFGFSGNYYAVIASTGQLVILDLSTLVE